MKVSSFPALRRRLLAWYRAHRRDLPWRRTRDPYRIWVSEIMLQQTQVATVLPYYDRFLKRFPDVRALARAPEAEVLRHWAGLGYYSRARNLREAARRVAGEGGNLPAEPEALRELPGIGRYTAGAIASIAFGKPAPLVDGNVIRVLSRLFGVDGDMSRPANQERIWELAGRLVKGEAPGDLNQALMELGATVCTPAQPNCAVCPVKADCRARGADAVERYPDMGKKEATVRVRMACAVVRREGRLLIEDRKSHRLLSTHWGLPAAEVSGGRGAQEALAASFPGLRAGAKLGSVSHSITHHRVTLDVPEGSLAGAPRKPLRWIPAASQSRYLVSSLFMKALEC